MRQGIKINGQRETIKMALAGMFIAMSFVIEMITKFAPFLQMPQGGAISLTMLPLVLAALILGPTYGFICGISFGLLNAIFDGYLTYWGSLFLDYLIAFGLVGFMGFLRPLFFKGKIWAYIVAICLACFLRYLSSVLSGALLFGQYAPEGQGPWLYSIIYNATYMGPSLALCLVIGLAIYKPVQKACLTSSVITSIYRVKSEVVQ